MLQKLKRLLTTAPILVYAGYSLPFGLQTDGNLKGTVLTQIQDDKELVIACTSRALRENAKNLANCSSFKLELLAIIWAVTEKFLDTLMGTEFLLLTDNNPLV